jgi:hypothetical protein
MYYIFKGSLHPTIATAMSQAQGGGFYNFKTRKKCEIITDIPNSNTDSTPIRLYRSVVVLETNFALDDSVLQAQAESLSEYYTDKAENVHAFLDLPDAQTDNKTKEQLDQLLEV